MINYLFGTGANESRRDSSISSNSTRGSSMDQETGVLSPRTLGELTESVRQLRIRRSPESMSVSTISPTLYRDNSSTEPPLMHITLRGSSASISSDYTRTGMSRAETSIENSQGFEYYDMASATGSFSNNDPMDGNQSGANPELSASPALYFSPRSMSSRNSSPKVTTAQVAKRLFIDGVNKIKEYAPKSIEIFNFETNNGKQKESPRAESSKRNIRPQVIGNKSAKEVLESNVKATQERMRKGQDDTAPGWLPVPPPTFCNSWDQDPTEFLNKFCKHVNALEQILTLEETYTYLETFLEGRIKKTLTDLMVIEEDWEEYCKLFVTTCNKYRDTSEARKQFEKYNLYNNNPITTFADLKRLFRNMNVTDEEKMSEEVFKKLNPTDKQHMRNNKDGITMKTMLSYMIQREEDYIETKKSQGIRINKNDYTKTNNYNKNNIINNNKNRNYNNNNKNIHNSSKAQYNTSIKNNNEFNSNQFKLRKAEDKEKTHRYETPTKNSRNINRNINNVRCYKCRQNGHYANDCPSDIQDVEMKTATPINRSQEGYQREINLVDLQEQAMAHPTISQRDMSKKINAILGKVRINGIETWFQYDSGAATNLMSYKMAQKLKLGRGHESSVTIVGVEGRKTESRYYPSVKLTFDTFNIQVPMYSIEQGKPDLLLLGVDLLACLKAQINMDKQLISCNIKGQTHQIPLMLRHEEGKEITDDPKEINLIDVTGKVINQDLTELYKQRLENMLKENEDEFANNLEEFQGARVEPVKVELLEKGPIQCKPYRLAKRLQEEVMDQIVEMETQGVIVKSKSPYCFPMVVVNKKDGKKRICVDYRKLNEISKKDAYPIPNIDEILSNLQGSKYFTTLDALSGYWQIPLDLKTQEMTAFTPGPGLGLYQFTVLPFGLTNAPAIFQRVMEEVLKSELHRCVLVYIDDIIIYSKTFDEHIQDVYRVIELLRTKNIKLHSEKCRIGYTEVKYLGHTISTEGIKPDTENVEKVKNMSPPRNVDGIRSYLGLVGYYRKFIKGFSSVAKPLTTLTKKDVKFTWGTAQQEAYDYLQQQLVSRPILSHPDWALDFTLLTDASKSGLGAILAQGPEGKEKVICYASRTLSSAETNYSITHLEGLAVVWAITHFHYYLYGRKFTVITDHSALVELFKKEPAKGRIGRWILKLRHYDFDVVHREGKNNPADYLSRFPWEDIPEQIEEVLYISVHGYEELRNSLQDKKSSHDNNNILSKLSVQGKDIIHTDKEKRKYLHPNELYETIYNIHYEQHRDVAATYQYLNDHFYAPNSYPVVKLIVQRCEVCQRTNYIQRRAENLHPVIPSEPFRVWGLDVAGPINPATEPEGNRYIIMAVDYFTKWPVALPVKSVNAETICTFIVELIIANFGVPKMLITDRGTHLSNEACARFNEFLGIEQKPVTAYRPSANGQIERSIQTLKQLLIKQTISRPGCWDAYIWRSLLTMRTTPHRTLGRSPAEIVYGLKLLTPEVWNSYIPTDIEKTLAMRSRINYLENKIPTYRRLIIELAKKQKIFDEERYNRGVRKRNLEIGDKVLKATTTRNPYTMHRNVGPFTVINDLGNGVYEIEDRKGHVDNVHVDRLRKYFPEYEIIPNLVTGSTRTTGAYVSKKPTNIDLIEDDQELRGEMSNE